MNCKFCAEEIKDDATLCRFCGAKKIDGEWESPLPHSRAAAHAAPKGSFTIRLAGVFYLLSAVFDLVSLTTSVPLFGAIRGGAVAVIYHLVYASLFLLMGAGLLRARRWGFRAVFAGTLLYTLDKSLYLLDRETMELQLMEQLQAFSEFSDMIDEDSILRMAMMTTALFVVCWWGFVLYLYRRREFFQR